MMISTIDDSFNRAIMRLNWKLCSFFSSPKLSLLLLSWNSHLLICKTNFFNNNNNNKKRVKSRVCILLKLCTVLYYCVVLKRVYTHTHNSTYTSDIVTQLLQSCTQKRLVLCIFLPLTLSWATWHTRWFNR